MNAKSILLLIAVSMLFSCKQEQKEPSSNKKQSAIQPFSAEMMENAIIYEANIRQYSTEGTFSAFTKDIPELKKLGVKVIWLMPIFPISETKRKATGGEFASLIKDEKERKKMLGSYYAVSDFTKINPEFGTMETFRELVATAHANGIYVILDWVPNHTGWDHTWLQTNPEYYTQDANGNVIHPEGTDWTDVADLNYENKEMRKEMIEDMKFWITKEGVDGFRCDVAGSVPTNFWEEAIPQLRAEKDIFMLAEAWEPELLKDSLFDMAYGWDRHHTMNDIAKGKEAVKKWNETMEKDLKRYAADDVLMTFVTNHDENSWNGTITERMGKAAEALTVLSYVAPGMPLIYSGQEYDLDHRLKFFEKDSIPKEKKNMWRLLEKLGKLKNTNPALHGGKNAAAYKSMTKDGNVIVIERSNDDAKLIYLANLSDQPAKIALSQKGSFKDYFNGTTITLEGDEVSLSPWAYKILIK
jgi:1,4-alpha-glucan branching enzyme